jgi:hypothetical protein
MVRQRAHGVNAAEAPCSRCGATPETGQREGCPECEGILPAAARPDRSRRRERAEDVLVKVAMGSAFVAYLILCVVAMLVMVR